MKKKFLLLITLSLFFISCGKEVVTIANLNNGIVAEKAKNELLNYLPKIYRGVEIESCSDQTVADITLLTIDQISKTELKDVVLPDVAESYKVLKENGKLYIISNNERGLLDATYALLERLGCGFYLTKETLPKAKAWDKFAGWNIEDSPVVESRFLFNWHNFISGCTGWNLDDWKQWVAQASKMRYNAIMIHAYGNNPMFSFDYMGETKTSGYVNNTASGRDWGNQHLNDVRRIVGGELFDKPIYGADISFATEENRVKETTELMQQVFSYSDSCGVDVIFALDLDTWMSNPQNIIEKMPKESLFNINGYLTPNPEDEEGYKYYKNQLKTLLDTYPEIDEITTWTRNNPNFGTIWMAFSYKQFPNNWKKEYDAIMRENPNVKNEIRTQGLFAFTKIIKALQRAAKELNSDVVVGYGSWTFEWLHIMDLFAPKDVPFRPLDALIKFEDESYDNYMASVAENRTLYPIVWAHHDDFAYIGRPYVPYENLTDIIHERKLKGIGIIHWTTHPLDLYFTGTSAQLWNSSANYDYHKVVDRFVVDQFGEASPELMKYFNEWAINGPIFGRETTDHFTDLGQMHQLTKLKSWESLVEPTKERIELMDKTPKKLRNEYWKYQRAMEDFFLSFFNNQIALYNSYNLLKENKVEEAKELLKATNPKVSIQKYVDAHRFIPITAGEEGVVITLNSRWLTDFININQRVGLERVKALYTPTFHDPLAQGAGKNSYFIDNDGEWWICYWENEFKDHKFKMVGEKGAIYNNDKLKIALTSIHKNLLPAGKYRFKVETNNLKDATCNILEDGVVIATKPVNNVSSFDIEFSSKGKKLELELIANGEIEIYSYCDIFE